MSPLLAGQQDVSSVTVSLKLQLTETTEEGMAAAFYGEVSSRPEAPGGCLICALPPDGLFP